MWRKTLMFTVVGIFLAIGTASAGVIPPITVGLPDLNNHDLGPLGLDNNSSAEIGQSQRDDWTVTVVNSSTFKWDDFHILIVSGIVSLKLNGVTVTNWGTLIGPQKFDIQGSSADFEAPLNNVEKPNSTILLKFSVQNGGSGSTPYHLRIKATVPEPASITIFGAALIAMFGFLWLRRMSS